MTYFTGVLLEYPDYWSASYQVWYCKETEPLYQSLCTHLYHFFPVAIHYMQCIHCLVQLYVDKIYSSNHVIPFSSFNNIFNSIVLFLLPSLVTRPVCCMSSPGETKAD